MHHPLRTAPSSYNVNHAVDLSAPSVSAKSTSSLSASGIDMGSMKELQNLSHVQAFHQNTQTYFEFFELVEKGLQIENSELSTLVKKNKKLINENQTQHLKKIQELKTNLESTLNNLKKEYKQKLKLATSKIPNAQAHQEIELLLESTKMILNASYQIEKNQQLIDLEMQAKKASIQTKIQKLKTQDDLRTLKTITVMQSDEQLITTDLAQKTIANLSQPIDSIKEFINDDQQSVKIKNDIKEDIEKIEKEFNKIFKENKSDSIKYSTFKKLLLSLKTIIAKFKKSQAIDLSNIKKTNPNLLKYWEISNQIIELNNQYKTAVVNIKLETEKAIIAQEATYQTFITRTTAANELINFMKKIKENPTNLTSTKPKSKLTTSTSKGNNMSRTQRSGSVTPVSVPVTPSRSSGSAPYTTSSGSAPYTPTSNGSAPFGQALGRRGAAGNPLFSAPAPSLGIAGLLEALVDTQTAAAAVGVDLGNGFKPQALQTMGRRLKRATEAHGMVVAAGARAKGDQDAAQTLAEIHMAEQIAHGYHAARQRVEGRGKKGTNAATIQFQRALTAPPQQPRIEAAPSGSAPRRAPSTTPSQYSNPIPSVHDWVQPPPQSIQSNQSDDAQSLSGFSIDRSQQPVKRAPFTKPASRAASHKSTTSKSGARRTASAAALHTAPQPPTV